MLEFSAAGIRPSPLATRQFPLQIKHIPSFQLNTLPSCCPTVPPSEVLSTQFIDVDGSATVLSPTPTVPLLRWVWHAAAQVVFYWALPPTLPAHQNRGSETICKSWSDSQERSSHGKAGGLVGGRDVPRRTRRQEMKVGGVGRETLERAKCFKAFQGSWPWKCFCSLLACICKNLCLSFFLASQFHTRDEVIGSSLWRPEEGLHTGGYKSQVPWVWDRMPTG